MTAPLRFEQVRSTTKYREELIAEIAYYKPLNRGFVPWQALADWLAAENEVDQKPCERDHRKRSVWAH